jgi:peptidoglycan DL-endopeptidase RipA
MRRNCRGSSFRVATAFTHRVGPAVISVALLLGTPGLAKADPDTMAKLIADVAQANQRLQDLNAQIQTEEESVNKAQRDRGATRRRGQPAIGQKRRHRNRVRPEAI